MRVLDLVRPHLLGAEGYKSARSIALEAEVFLDANESPRPLGASRELAGLNRYPAPQPPGILREAARCYGVAAGRIVVTRGADEGIDLLLRAFLEPGRDAILVTPPTYGEYAIAARLHGAAVVEAPLDASRGFALDPTQVLSAARSAPVKLVFLCVPNNPTGTGAPLSAVEELAAGLAGRALVAVDEAYLEFSGAASATGLLERRPNVAVLRTLSKAWGLAGARCGFLLADPKVAELMQKLRAPYPISAASARAVERVFNAKGEKAMRRSVAGILASRARLMGAVGRLRCVGEVRPSEANFFLARFRDPAAALRALRAKGILVRDRGSEPGLAGCIRITVGAESENRRLLAVLEGLDG